MLIRRSYESSAVACVRGAGIGTALRRPMVGRSLGQRGEDFGRLRGLCRCDLRVCRGLWGAALLATGMIMLFLHTFVHEGTFLSFDSTRYLILVEMAVNSSAISSLRFMRVCVIVVNFLLSRARVVAV